jgi:hypothetical protein
MGLFKKRITFFGDRKIEVTNAGGLVAVQGYTLTTRENHLPVIGLVPKTQVTVGNTYRYDVKAIL